MREQLPGYVVAPLQRRRRLLRGRRELRGGPLLRPANPLTARIVVLAGGGACTGDADCRAGQTCVADQCQAGGEDANRPLVIVNADLVGVDPGRLGELLLGRYGIPKENLIFAATHDHAAIRNIKLFVAPYYEDRSAPVRVVGRGPDRGRRRGRRMSDMQPVRLSTGTGSASLGVNRRQLGARRAHRRQRDQDDEDGRHACARCW